MDTFPTVFNYDFQNSFINPDLQTDQIAPENLDFSSMLSLYFRENVIFHSGSVGKFDAVTYFLHFFLGLLIDSKRPFYWYYDDQNQQLKAFLINEEEKKIKLKCFNFEPKKRNDVGWSDPDLKNMIAELGSKIDGATIESHWYDIHVENLVHPDEVQIDKRNPVPLRRMVSPEIFFTEKTGLLKIENEFFERAIKLRRKAPKNFQKFDLQPDNLQDVVSKMIKAKKTETAEKYVTKLTNNGRKILANIQNRYKQSLKSFQSDAHCGLLHSILLNYQKSSSFLTKIQHTLNTEPPGYKIEFKKLALETIINELPIRIEIPANLQKAGKRKNQILAESTRAHGEYIVIETLAKDAILALTNLNADEGFHILIKKLKVADPAYTLIEDILAGVERNAVSKDVNFPQDLNEFLEYEIGVILRDEIPLHRPQKLNYLSRYFKGYLTASEISKERRAFELYSKNSLQYDCSYMKSYIVKSKNQGVDYVINFYEKDQFSSDDFSLITKYAQNRLYPTTSADQTANYVIVTDVLVFFTDHYENSKQYLEKIVNTYRAPITENSEDFRLEQIDFLDINREMIDLEKSEGEGFEARMKISRFVNKNAHLLEKNENLKALFDGLLHKEKRVTNTGKDIFQINFPSKTSAKLFSINLALGQDTKVNLEKLRSVHNPNDVNTLSVSVSKQGADSTLRAMVLDEKYLSGLISCMKNSRRKKKDCSKFQELEEISKETIQTKEARSKTYLKNLNRLSSAVMYGLMTKTFASDLINGDLTGLAVNFGFIISSIGATKLAKKLLTKAATLSPAENLVLSNALKIGAPFLRRAPSFLFVALDLYENIRSFSNNDDHRSENLVNLGADITYLALDLAETAIELGEVLGVGTLAGVSTATGPVMWAAGAVVLLGAEIYKSVKKVESIDKVIHLTKIERFSEGFRAFFGVNPEEHVQDLINEKQDLNKLLPKMKVFLENHREMSKYIFPIKRQENQDEHSIIDLRWKRKLHVARSIPTGYDLFCQFEETTENPKFSSSTLNIGTYQNKNSTYLCQNSLGLKKSDTVIAGITYVQLGDTLNTIVYGPLSGRTVFDVSGHGQKALYGGEGSNRFILRGNNSLIYIYGPKNAENTLDLSNFVVKSRIRYTDKFLRYYENSKKLVYYENINIIIGRQNFTDKVKAWCSIRHLELLGGGLNPDEIEIPDEPCNYNMSISFGNGDTILINNAIAGSFRYSFGDLNGSSFVRLPEKLQQVHKFYFKYPLTSLQSLSTDFNDTKAINTWTKFCFKNGAVVIIDSLINLDNFEVHFDDGANFLLKNGHGVLHMKSIDTIETITETYGELLANSTVSMIATSQIENQTITITGSSRNVNYGVDLIFNDPNSNHRAQSYQHEAIFIIKADENLKMKNVTIQISDYKNIVDLSRLEEQLQNDNISIKLEPNGNDIIISIMSLKFTGNIILRKAMENENFKRIIIFEKCHMRIEIGNSTILLKPEPLIFDNSRNLVVITDNDGLYVGNEVIINRKIGKSAIYRMEDSLILTNIPYTLPANAINAFTLILKNYESSTLLKSLTFSFVDVKYSGKDISAKSEDDYSLFLKRIFVEQYIW